MQNILSFAKTNKTKTFHNIFFQRINIAFFQSNFCQAYFSWKSIIVLIITYHSAENKKHIFNAVPKSSIQYFHMNIKKLYMQNIKTKMKTFLPQFGTVKIFFLCKLHISHKIKNYFFLVLYSLTRKILTPFSFPALISAPFLIKYLAMSVWPWSTAAYSGVHWNTSNICYIYKANKKCA